MTTQSQCIMWYLTPNTQPYTMFEQVNIKKLVHVLENKNALANKIKYCEFKQTFPINCLSWKIIFSLTVLGFTKIQNLIH